MTSGWICPDCGTATDGDACPRCMRTRTVDVPSFAGPGSYLSILYGPLGFFRAGRIPAIALLVLILIPLVTSIAISLFGIFR